jgi:hypothetical protein
MHRCLSLLPNVTQLLHLYLYKTNAVYKFCVTDHEVNFNFVNWYLHGVNVLEIVSKFFLFSDGWFHLCGRMVSQTIGTSVHKIIC